MAISEGEKEVLAKIRSFFRKSLDKWVADEKSFVQELQSNQTLVENILKADKFLMQKTGRLGLVLESLAKQVAKNSTQKIGPDTITAVSALHYSYWSEIVQAAEQARIILKEMSQGIKGQVPQKQVANVIGSGVKRQSAQHANQTKAEIQAKAAMAEDKHKRTKAKKEDRERRREDRRAPRGKGGKRTHLPLYEQSVVYNYIKNDFWNNLSPQLLSLVKQQAVFSTDTIRKLITSKRGELSKMADLIRAVYETNYIFDYSQMVEAGQVETNTTLSAAESIEAEDAGLQVVSGKTEASRMSQEGLNAPSTTHSHQTPLNARLPSVLWLGLSFGNIRVMDQIRVHRKSQGGSANGYPFWMILEYGTFGKFTAGDIGYADSRYGKLDENGALISAGPFGAGYTFPKKGPRGSSGNAAIPRVNIEIAGRLRNRKKRSEYYPIRLRGNKAQPNAAKYMMIKRGPSAVTASGPFHNIEDGVKGFKRRKSNIEFDKTKTFLENGGQLYDGIPGQHYLAKGIPISMAALETAVNSVYMTWMFRMEGIVRQVNQETAEGRRDTLNALEATLRKRQAAGAKSQYKKR